MIKLSLDKYKELQDQINADKPVLVETTDDWRHWVSEPVIKHALAPREARAILELFGELGDHGIRTSALLQEIMIGFFEVG